MKPKFFTTAYVAVLISGCFFFSSCQNRSSSKISQISDFEPAENYHHAAFYANAGSPEGGDPTSATPQPLSEAALQGLDFLASSQESSGGWGAGSNGLGSGRPLINEGPRSRDQISPKTEVTPGNQVTDPATTAFAAMALVRSGNTLTTGKYSNNVRKAMDHLLKVVEDAPVSGPQITDQTGTQPQRKLGANIDVMLTCQFLSRILPLTTEGSSDHKRITTAIDKCITKIQSAQSGDGSWNSGGWAPVLQSTMANSALEMAQTSGRKVDGKVLQKSRDYQRGNFNEKTGELNTGSAAGVSLYTYSANQRANINEYSDAVDRVEKARKKGTVSEDAEINAEVLIQSGATKEDAIRLEKAYNQVQASKSRLNDDALLRGFGNNGGEEFLSLMLSSESLAATGGKEWEEWNTKMQTTLSGIQNGDGSWSGHHCITSPVFCTAAVVLCLSADRDTYVTRKSD